MNFTHAGLEHAVSSDCPPSSDPMSSGNLQEQWKSKRKSSMLIHVHPFSSIFMSFYLFLGAF